jgi:hypothetical protein
VIAGLEAPREGNEMRKALTILAAITIVVVATGVALASIPDANGMIHGCYDTKHGNLRVIDMEAGQTCDPNETLLSWNQTGPQGPAGPPGPQGPQGPQGPAGEPGGEAFSVEADGSVTIPTTIGGTVILQRDVPAGKYVVTGNVVVSNLNSTGTIPVLCYLGSPSEFSPPYVAAIDPFRFTSPDQPSGASATTIALTFTTELTAPGTLTLLCQSNTGPGGLTALAGSRQLTAIRVGTLTEQDLAP